MKSDHVILHLQSHEDGTEWTGEGGSLLLAIADIERQTLDDGDISLGELLLDRRDLEECMRALSDPGTTFDSLDFSTPEQNCTISRR